MGGLPGKGRIAPFQNDISAFDCRGVFVPHEIRDRGVLGPEVLPGDAGRAGRVLRASVFVTQNRAMVAAPRMMVAIDWIQSVMKEWSPATTATRARTTPILREVGERT